MTTQSTDSSATTDEHRNRNTERAQLHSTIWRIANDLRGSVDGWDFKQYVLGMLFYRYLSERLVKHLSDASSGGNYAALSDSFIDAEGKRDVIKNLGFSSYPQSSFPQYMLLHSVMITSMRPFIRFSNQSSLQLRRFILRIT